MSTKRYVNVKRSEEIQLDGITAELALTEHGNAQDLVLRDASGHELKVRSTYGLEVQVPAPPKTVERWKLSGIVPGIRTSVLEYFETEFAARGRLSHIDDVLRVDAALKVERVDVLEEEADKFDGERIAAAIPF